MAVPTNSIALMVSVYKDVMPSVHRELSYWKERAIKIPNQELRMQALASIQSKTFHCEGGSIMALTALTEREKAIKFIVAYQTISDYLDNLCDRSTSLDPLDFEALHDSMKDALSVGAAPQNYYRYRNDQQDGGYLLELMQTCQSVLSEIPHYETIKPYLVELCSYYCELQIHKHVHLDEREDRLINWFEEKRELYPDMDWYEFSACAGSTLGIFCLISYSLRDDFKAIHAEQIRASYFPYIQGLHILLDYIIDQEEDRVGGDLNFCFYYKDETELYSRLEYFVKESDKQTSELPDQKFHRLINRGLLGIYLSDQKVNQQKDVKKLTKKVLKQGGTVSRFFYFNGRAYRWWQQRKSVSF